MALERSSQLDVNPFRPGVEGISVWSEACGHRNGGWRWSKAPQVGLASNYVACWISNPIIHPDLTLLFDIWNVGMLDGEFARQQSNMLFFFTFFLLVSEDQDFGLPWLAPIRARQPVLGSVCTVTGRPAASNLLGFDRTDMTRVRTPTGGILRSALMSHATPVAVSPVSPEFEQLLKPFCGTVDQTERICSNRATMVV